MKRATQHCIDLSPILKLDPWLRTSAAKVEAVGRRVARLVGAGGEDDWITAARLIESIVREWRTRRGLPAILPPLIDELDAISDGVTVLLTAGDVNRTLLQLGKVRNVAAAVIGAGSEGTS